MVDTFLDVAADSPVPALSGTHSISQYMLLYERLNILISSHKKWYKTRTWLTHDDGKKNKTKNKTKQNKTRTKQNKTWLLLFEKSKLVTWLENKNEYR